MSDTNASPTIVAVHQTVRHGSANVRATLSDGAVTDLFRHYMDELSFTDAELIGLTVEAAWRLRAEKDVAYLRSSPTTQKGTL